MAYEPTEAELAAAPKITVGGKEFSIVKQAPKQLRAILPAAFRINPHLTSGTMPESVMDDFVTVIHTAIRRGHPAITREEFEEMPVGLDEMIVAFGIILTQCGSGVVVKDDAADAPFAPAPTPSRK